MNVSSNKIILNTSKKIKKHNFHDGEANDPPKRTWK